MAEVTPQNPFKVDRAGLENLAKRRYFYAPAFSIYGGVAGLYDFGPPGCAVKANVLEYWRRHFILEENMQQIETTIVTPEPVFRASGHTERFTDLLVEDSVTGEAFRADHLLEEAMDQQMEKAKGNDALLEELEMVKRQADCLSADEMDATLAKYGVQSPGKNPLGKAYPFNLMFATGIGPSKKSRIQGYLRPETAQGIFVNFKRLLEFNGGRLPFAGATMGQAFRNEIAPRNALLRVREFTLAEIEHFLDPEKKDHPRFSEVADVEMQLFSRDLQMSASYPVSMTIGDAVAKGIVDNQSLGYFMARTLLFLKAIGMRPDGVRFRQHLASEMAHYAADCWDAECFTSYGWVECVGIADRSCYDLEMHTKHGNTPMVAQERFQQPVRMTLPKIKVNKGTIGKLFKKAAAPILQHCNDLTLADVRRIKADFGKDGRSASCLKHPETGDTLYLTPDMFLTLDEEEKDVHSRTFIPSVIEPAFGIGRIVYALLEQCYYTREGDASRGVLRFTPLTAPVKASVLPLSAHESFRPVIAELSRQLTAKGVSHKVDDTGASIGKRYARTDEIGIPFGMTVDFDSLEDKRCTLRDRDSMLQVRLPLAEVADVVAALSDGRTLWTEVYQRYPHFAAGEE